MNEALDKETSRLVERLIGLEYKIGDIVYLRADEHAVGMMVTGYYLSKNELLYELRTGDYKDFHYGYEIIEKGPLDGLDS